MSNLTDDSRMYDLAQFLDDINSVQRSCSTPSECVHAIAPMMHKLLMTDRAFLKPAHFRDDPVHYARNAIYVPDDGGLGLYALVWNPGQWTPVHDHGTWGVVGVVKGVLEERNYIRVDHDNTSNEAIELVAGGTTLLTEGTVTTFVPNPDHIHITGVASDREQVVSLHLYGKIMNSFHVYDVEAGTRTLIDVFHNES